MKYLVHYFSNKRARTHPPSLICSLCQKPEQKYSSNCSSSALAKRVVKIVISFQEGENKMGQISHSPFCHGGELLSVLQLGPARPLSGTSSLSRPSAEASSCCLSCLLLRGYEMFSCWSLSRMYAEPNSNWGWWLRGWKDALLIRVIGICRPLGKLAKTFF